MRSGWGRALTRGVLRLGPMLALALGLAACGFHPMMGSAGNGNPAVVNQLERVQIATIADRTGQQLRNRLIDRFYHAGRSAQPEYRLDVTLDSQSNALTVDKNAVASRAQWTVNATYRLVHLATNKVLFQDTDQAITAYNISYAQYASLVSEQAALQRGLELMGDRIATRIALYFARDPDQRPALTGGK